MAALAVAALFVPPATAEEAVAVGDLRHGDLVRAELVHGGMLEGMAVACSDDALQLRIEGSVETLDLVLVQRLVRVHSGGDLPLPGIRVEEEPQDADDIAALKRTRRRADALAAGSFFVPGSGQFATGQPGLGATYLIGTLLIDATLILNIVVNREYVLTAVLGALDLTARITSAALARESALRMHAWCAPMPGEPGVAVGLGFAF